MFKQIIATTILSMIPTFAMANEKPYIDHINVDLTKQKLYLHWTDNRPEQIFLVSTGKGVPGIRNYCSKHHQDAAHCTPTGDFYIFPNGDENTVDTMGFPMSWYSELKDIPKKPHSRSITGAGIGIHGKEPLNYISKNQTSTASLGCIRLGDDAVADREAKLIHDNIKNNKTIVHIYGIAPSP